MTIEQLRKVMKSKPFRPFTLRIADGSRIRVPHPDFLWFGPDAPRSIVVYEDGGYFIVDLLLVAAIDLTSHKAGGPKSNGRHK